MKTDKWQNKNKRNKYAETKASEGHGRAVEGNPHSGRKTEKVSGKHSGTGKRVYCFRGRAHKPEDAERVPEEPEEYRTTTRYTRHIESSLGIKSYSELAPLLAKGVECVMASLLEQPPDEIKIWVNKEFKDGRNDTVHDFLAFLSESAPQSKKVNHRIGDIMRFPDKIEGKKFER